MAKTIFLDDGNCWEVGNSLETASPWKRLKLSLCQPGGALMGPSVQVSALRRVTGSCNLCAFHSANSFSSRLPACDPETHSGPPSLRTCTCHLNVSLRRRERGSHFLSGLRSTSFCNSTQALILCFFLSFWINWSVFFNLMSIFSDTSTPRQQLLSEI